MNLSLRKFFFLRKLIIKKCLPWNVKKKRKKGNFTRFEVYFLFLFSLSSLKFVTILQKKKKSELLNEKNNGKKDVTVRVSHESSFITSLLKKYH